MEQERKLANAIINHVEHGDISRVRIDISDREAHPYEWYMDGTTLVINVEPKEDNEERN